MSQLLFAQTFQSGNSSFANGLVQAFNGDYDLVGRVFDAGDNSAAVALRVTPSGTVLWQNIYSGPFPTFFKAVTQLADGTFVAVGSFFFSEFAGDEYIWVVRLDENGDKIWEEAFGTKDEQSDGQDVAATADGGFVVAGLFIERESDRTGTRVLKFAVDNTLEWDRRFDTGIAFAIRQTRDGGYILSGAKNIPGSLNSIPFVLRLDGDGNKVWDQFYTDYPVYVPLNGDIVETDTGNFIFVLKSLIMEIDCCGRTIWAHQSGALNLGTIALLSGNRPVVGGSLIVNNFDHAYVAALLDDGRSILWDNTEISYPSGINKLIVNRDGLVAAAGYLPVNINQSQMFLAIYNPVQVIVS